MNPDRTSHSTERTAIKLIMGGLAGFVLLIALIVFGYKMYVRLEGDRLIHRAHAFFDVGDLKSAALTAGRAFQMNSRNAGAARILADIGERQGDSAAIGWRQHVVSLLPHSVEDGIALARTALQFKELDVAEGSLARIRDSAKDSPAFHEMAAELASARNESRQADEELTEAVRLAPLNRTYQLKLALLKLQSTSLETRGRAEASLKSFLDDTQLRAAAMRALRDSAAQRQDASGLLESSKSLTEYPEATFRDRLTHVQILRALNQPEFAAKLEDLQNEAAKDPAKLSFLLTWMSNNNLSILAVDWARRLPADATMQTPVSIALAECYVGASDWNGLTKWCKKGSWGDLDGLRHGYLARAARGRDEDLAFRSEWNDALHEAGSNGNRVLILEQAAVKWGWKKEAEELLWTLGKDPNKQKAALASLSGYYAEKGQTADLLRVVARLAEINPDDESTQNNQAQLSLLLGVNVIAARAQAEELYKKHPESAAFASTYAFSLFQNGRAQEAVKVMSRFKEKDLRDPDIAAYYGIFLAAVGDGPKSAEYLEIGAHARLFPEEKQLFEKARKAFGVPPP